MSPDLAPPNHAKTWRFWGGACFVIVLLGAFAQPLFALLNYAARSDLHSYILLIPFVSAYLIYLRRDQLPKKCVIDLPVAITFLVTGIATLAFTGWWDFAGQAPAGNYSHSCC